MITKTTIVWDTLAAANALRISGGEMMGLLMDGRSASWIMMAWLTSNGYTKHPDGKSGWFFIKGGRPYRLRIATEKLSFLVSSAKGVGRNAVGREDQQWEEISQFDFLVVFAYEMPDPQLYVMTSQFVKQLQQHRLLDWKYEGDSTPIYKVIQTYNENL